MAQRRMFSKQIIESDAFLDMSKSAQILYIHLCMAADDDGVVNNVKRVMRVVGCRKSDLEMLKSARFVLNLVGSLLVIKHWKMNNSIRPDRYKPTEYQEELSKLGLKDNKSYTTGQPNGIPNVIPNDNQMSDTLEPQVSIGKVSIGKVSLGKKDIGQMTLTDQEQSKKNAIAKTVKKVKNYKTKNKNENIADLCDIFYTAYPKHIGRGKCLKWFKSHKPTKELVNRMVDTINIYKGSFEWADEQFIPHPYTWLNREGWDDELEVHNKASDIKLVGKKLEEEKIAHQKEREIINNIDLSDILGDD